MFSLHAHRVDIFQIKDAITPFATVQVAESEGKPLRAYFLGCSERLLILTDTYTLHYLTADQNQNQNQNQNKVAQPSLRTTPSFLEMMELFRSFNYWKRKGKFNQFAMDTLYDRENVDIGISTCGAPSLLSTKGTVPDGRETEKVEFESRMRWGLMSMNNPMTVISALTQPALIHPFIDLAYSSQYLKEWIQKMEGDISTSTISSVDYTGHYCMETEHCMTNEGEEKKEMGLGLGLGLGMGMVCGEGLDPELSCKSICVSSIPMGVTFSSHTELEKEQTLSGGVTMSNADYPLHESIPLENSNSLMGYQHSLIPSSSSTTTTTTTSPSFMTEFSSNPSDLDLFPIISDHMTSFGDHCNLSIVPLGNDVNCMTMENDRSYLNLSLL